MEDLFRRLLDEYPGAIIAGGAVRDHLLGKQVKDIDLWMSRDAFDRLRKSKLLLSGDLTAFNQRLTLVNERYTSPGRYAKLKKKFAGWKIDKPKEENDDI